MQQPNVSPAQAKTYLETELASITKLITERTHRLVLVRDLMSSLEDLTDHNPIKAISIPWLSLLQQDCLAAELELIELSRAQQQFQTALDRVGSGILVVPGVSLQSRQ